MLFSLLCLFYSCRFHWCVYVIGVVLFPVLSLFYSCRFHWFANAIGVVLVVSSAVFIL